MTREEAAQAIRHDISLHHDYLSGEYRKALRMAVDSLEQPEREKGEWIIRDNPGTGWYRVTCPECGEDVTSTIPLIGFFPDVKPLWDFCPDCGADMRGEQE